MNITFEFACQDDCLDRMVPSDLRLLVGERDKLREALTSMVESYSILANESPLAKHEVALGVIRGAFVGAVAKALDCLSKPQAAPG